MNRPVSNPLHLYRAILRECTYLPDGAARTFQHQHVVSRFRQYIPKRRSQWTRQELPATKETRVLAEARKRLSLLSRANEGYLEPLHRILMETYGRRGRRRRDLMTAIIAEPAPPQVAPDDSASPDHASLHRYSESWRPPHKFYQLMRSQSHLRRLIEPCWPKKISVKADFNRNNIWGRQISKTRHQRQMRKWYAKNADSILPPLPDTEYERLKALANGTRTEILLPVPRRLKGAQDGSDRDATRVEMDSETLLDGPLKGKTFQPYVRGRPHRITPRVMQRLWTTVLKTTPRITHGAAR